VPNRTEAIASGDLTFINNTVDPGTGTIQLKATFNNADNALWPGQFLDAVLTLTSQQAIVVPSQAIQPGQKGPYVFVVKEDQTVENREVQPGARLGAETIIASGLKPGERVVTDGQLRLRPGARADAKAQGNLPRQSRGAPRLRRGASERGGVWGAISGPPSLDNEPRALHPASRPHDAGDGGNPHLRHHGLSAATRERPAQRRLPDDPGAGDAARGEPRDHGVGGRDTARETVHHDRRHRFDDVVERPGPDRHHEPVLARTLDRTRRPRR